MKNRLKYISILVCSSLFLTMNVSALSEKQILPLNNSSFDDIDIVEMINSVNESKVLYYLSKSYEVWGEIYRNF